MAIKGDEPVALPAAPPPRPAARRAAIAAALRKFDGESLEPAAGTRARGGTRWTGLNRRPAGALVAAAVVAIVGIPAIQVALREPSPTAPSGHAAPATPPAGGLEGRQARPEGRSPAAAGTAPAKPSVPAAGNAAAAGSAEPTVSAEAASAAGQPNGFPAPVERERKALMAAPTAAMDAAPAPPATITPAPSSPPPPSAPESRAEASPQESIMVPGSRAARSTPMAPDAAAASNPDADFLAALRAAVRSGDRSAVMRHVGFPLRVGSSKDMRTYRSATELEADYERVFTPSVRRTILSLRPGALERRDGGRLRGGDGLWFGCEQPSCGAGSTIRIRQITP